MNTTCITTCVDETVLWSDYCLLGNLFEYQKCLNFSTLFYFFSSIKYESLRVLQRGSTERKSVFTCSSILRTEFDNSFFQTRFYIQYHAYDATSFLSLHGNVNKVLPPARKTSVFASHLSPTILISINSLRGAWHANIIMYVPLLIMQQGHFFKGVFIDYIVPFWRIDERNIFWTRKAAANFEMNWTVWLWKNV